MSLLNLLGINLPTLNPFQGLLNGSGALPGLMQNPQGTINPLRQALEQAFQPNQMAAGPGSQGGWGAQPGAGPFVSQDERSSLTDRMGMTPNQPTTQAQPPKEQTVPQMVGTGLLGGKTFDDGSIPESYYSSIRSAESGGNDNAKNPLSSAAGRYQFTAGTWGAVAKAHPELGLTPDGRFDSSQQERAIRAFTQDNARVLQANGIPLSGGSLYAAHFLGVGGAAHVYKQPDNAMMRDVVGPGVTAANGFLQNMTVGQFKNWAAKKGGGGGASGGNDVFAAPQTANVAGGGGGTGGDYNTALNVQRSQRRQRGGSGAPSSGTGPDAGGGGGAHKNQVNPDWQRYQARKNIDHLRALSPVATIQSLENIGKAIRSGASASA